MAAVSRKGAADILCVETSAPITLRPSIADSPAPHRSISSKSLFSRPRSAATSALSGPIRMAHSVAVEVDTHALQQHSRLTGTHMNAVPSRAAKPDDDSNPSEFEGEIREFIRRDVAHLRRAVPDGASEQAVTSINSLLDRVSGSSVTEIDGLIADLSNVREFLKNEGERVQREIASYAQLSQVAMTSVKIIAESMSQWKSQVSDARLDRA